MNDDPHDGARPDSRDISGRDTSGRETHEGQPQDAPDATVPNPQNAWTADRPRGDESWEDPFSARAEQSSYPEAGSPYAPPSPAASGYGQSSYRQPQYGQAAHDPAQYGSTQYGPTPYGPSQYGEGFSGQPAGETSTQPAYGTAGAPAPLSDQNERNMALAAHLGGLGGAVVTGGTLGWLAPLAIYLMYKDRSAYVRQHAAAALNFQIAVIIAVIASFLLMLILIGFLTIIGVGIVALIFPIIAAVAASDGRPYRYPLTPAMVN